MTELKTKPKYELELPDKPSELIRFAMTELAVVEQHPDYRIDMWEWHVPQEGLCSVCLAGAVMARVMPADIKFMFGHDFFSDETERKLDAIDAFRVGSVLLGVMKTLGVGLSSDSDDGASVGSVRMFGSGGIPELPDGLREVNRHVTQYDESPALFRDAMDRLAAELEKHGL